MTSCFVHRCPTSTCTSSARVCPAGGKGGDSCGWHKLIEQLRKKLAQRLGGGTVSETPSDEQVVKYLGGKVVAVVALEGEEAESARRVVKEAGWVGWNFTEVCLRGG